VHRISLLIFTHISGRTSKFQSAVSICQFLFPGMLLYFEHLVTVISNPMSILCTKELYNPGLLPSPHQHDVTTMSTIRKSWNSAIPCRSHHLEYYCNNRTCLLTRRYGHMTAFVQYSESSRFQSMFPEIWMSGFVNVDLWFLASDYYLFVPG